MAVKDVSSLTFGQVIGAAVVLLILLFVYNTVMAAVNNFIEARKRKSQPMDSLEEIVQQHDEKLRRDYERLNELESGTRIMMRSQMALLSHEINGNSDDKLRQSFDEIQQFLINR